MMHASLGLEKDKCERVYKLGCMCWKTVATAAINPAEERGQRRMVGVKIGGR